VLTVPVQPAQRCGDDGTPLSTNTCGDVATSVRWYAPNAPRETIAWEASVPLAYWAGLQDGVELERRRRDAEDDQVHREAVRRAVRIAERGEARDRADQKAVA
jgi:hypothetical protein